MIKKVFISSNKDIGLKCKKWAMDNIPNGFEIVNDMENCNIFISVLYDNILCDEFINSRRCYNFHPAILPNYAGVGTITWSILNNDKQHGITLHLIDKDIDSGDLIDIVKFEIKDDDTAYSLYNKTLKKIFLFFKIKFIDILNKNYKTKKQDLNMRNVYSYKKLDSIFNLTRYMRSTYFPGKANPYYYNKFGEKIELKYDGGDS